MEHTTHSEPEQEQPIDYHIPKRKDESVDEKEMKSRLIKRTSAIISRPIYSIWNSSAASDVKIMSAAAGHGRSNGQSGSQQSQQNSNGGGSNAGGLSYGGSGLGGVQNGSGGGSLNGGNDGNGGRDNRENRSNYGPNSPPTGSLPPFYERYVFVEKNLSLTGRLSMIFTLILVLLLKPKKR